VEPGRYIKRRAKLGAGLEHAAIASRGGSLVQCYDPILNLGMPMADLLISRVSPGILTATSTDPYSTLAVHRIERSAWREAPNESGVYLLFGFVNDRPAAYVGMSTTSILDRIRIHHVTPGKDWFGTLFAVPIGSSVLCQPVEAEMIRRIREAGVVDFVDNRSLPTAFLDADDVHIEPAVGAITEALEILLGSDIFSPSEEEDVATPDIKVVQKTPPLARVYKGAAQLPRARREDDPVEATHGWVGSQIQGWGRFEGDEPDARFTVLEGTHFRRATLNESNVMNKLQVNVERAQQELADQGVIDMSQLAFLKNHTFENWSRASYVVSGKGSYAGGYHWQLIE
jgi:hypothetical protein